MIAKSDGTHIYSGDDDWFAQVGAEEGSKQWKTRNPQNREERAAKELGWLWLVKRPTLLSRPSASGAGYGISPGHPHNIDYIHKTSWVLDNLILTST